MGVSCSTTARWLAVCVFAGGLLSAYAQTPPSVAAASGIARDGANPTKHRHRAGQQFNRLLSAIDASPEQRAKIRSIVHLGWQQSRSQREQLRQLRQQQLRLLAADPIDQRAVLDLSQQRAAIADLLAQSRTRTLLAVAAVLTPQQRQQALQLMQHRHGRVRQPRPRADH